MTKRITAVMLLVLLAAVGVTRAQSAYPKTFTDGKGHRITLQAKPTRIASTVLGVDENLVDLVEPSRIVAMTEISKSMPDVSNIANRVPAGVMLIKGPESVIAASPDLVLTATYTAAIADSLIARRLPVYQFSEWNSVDALLKNFEVLGQLIGEEQKAQAVLQIDRSTLAAAGRKKWPKRIRAIYYSEGAIFAANTVPSQVIALAGLTDAASEFGLSGYLKSSPALIRNLRPDMVLFGEDNDEEQKKTAALFKTVEYQSVPAIKAGKVYAIPGKHITTTSHLIVNAVVDVQNLVAAAFR
jgi:iron complex transport system substrate-binding protein